MNNNFQKQKICYGCGMCEVVCPQRVIKIEQSSDGFYIPKIIDKEKCKNCNLCNQICPYLNREEKLKSDFNEIYSAFSKNDEILKTCSSGGIAYEIGKIFINKGYKICGVRYNYDLNRAEHFVAENIDELELFKGSKYIQSYTVDAFKKFNLTDKWVVFGTPCQIDAIRRWIKLMRVENNYILIDILCHDVPSYLLWNSYLDYQSKKSGIKKFSKIVFRDKNFGWHDMMISLSNENKKIKNRFKRFDIFYSLFLFDLCLNDCCYRCRFKSGESSSDLRIGDFWGKKYQNNKKGVSKIIIHTKKGKEIINELKNNCIVNIEPNDQDLSNWTRKKPFLRNMVIKDLKNKKPIKYIFTYSALPNFFIEVFKKIINKLMFLIFKK